MNTPIKDFTDNYAKSGMIRAHMPGHKGKFPLTEFDITEIKGADSLFEADGIIAESEKNTSEIFHSYKTLYSAGGSTLCIFTMLAMCLMNGKNRRVAAVRNRHRSFLNACVFLDAEVEWIYPEYENTLVSGKITPEAVERAIEKSSPACVYLTSPDYLGHITEIDGIADICHKHGVMLLVDNAHGAYLNFIGEPPMHPNYHGADMCCDSAHKTLPALTGGAYLHINNPKAEKYEGYAKEIMSMFGSTSPSYLIMRSLDECADFMDTRAKKYFNEMALAADKAKSLLSPVWHIEDTEAGKLTLFTPPCGYTGTELADILREYKIECEYADHTHIVLMLTGLSADEITYIGKVISNLPQPRIFVPTPKIKSFSPLEKAMSIREAAFSDSEEISVSDAAGRICARAVSCCPPGIAAVVGGEKFSRESINILKNYSIFKVNVVK